VLVLVVVVVLVVGWWLDDYDEGRQRLGKTEHPRWWALLRYSGF
jgi:hypothetical protein